MSDLDPRLGFRSETQPVRPSRTLSGQNVPPHQAPPTKRLTGDWYCVLDVFPPRDFDEAAEAAALTALIPQPDSSSSAPEAVEDGGAGQGDEPAKGKRR